MSSTNEEKKTYTKPYVCYDKTPIIFGKLKGKEHSILKKDEWKDYGLWIVNQGEDFKYPATRDYILKNVSSK